MSTKDLELEWDYDDLVALTCPHCDERIFIEDFGFDPEIADRVYATPEDRRRGAGARWDRLEKIVDSLRAKVEDLESGTLGLLHLERLRRTPRRVPRSSQGPN